MPEHELHDYQKVASAHLRSNRRAALMLDMGLGKTAATLAALEPKHLPALVLAPKRVSEDVWPVETPKWRPDLRCEVAEGSPAQRKAVLAESTADVVSLGVQNIQDLRGMRRRWNTVVIDELSGYKNKTSERWKVASKLAGLRFQRNSLTGLVDDAPHVWGLTGTPAPNGLLDLWGQITLLDGGARLGNTLSGFRLRYFTAGRQLPNGVVTRWDLRPGAEAAIHAKIDDICLSMETEGRIELPPVTHNVVTVPMPAKIRKAYLTLKKDRVLAVEVLGREILNPVSSAALGSKLAQLSAGFIFAEDSDATVWDVHHDEKVKAVREIVDGTGSPVLVFYRFRPELEMLQKALPEASTVHDKDVFRRWDRGEVPVLLAHPASIGHGMNLQHGGYTAIWTSPTWDLEHWEQANKRLARQGQKHPVVIHRIQMAGSIDAAIYGALAEKTSVQKALLDHLESPL